MKMTAGHGWRHFSGIAAGPSLGGGAHWTRFAMSPGRRARSSSIGIPLDVGFAAGLGRVSLPMGTGISRGTRDAIPIQQQGQEQPAGFLVVGTNPYRRYDRPTAVVGFAGGADRGSPG